ncbi:hypothetical protein COCOR_02975 [Corallococcus coralloides DSM 2259]|uniref:Uncharacterized protein n=1 Tax=Corallococcus coralloides (strain ATCC 25202 / DSM 2259 / NBRC 100086 / M2) TaxID=1144275 RepID=H8N096_CORCM|nr:hypothetical protein [Corallococcus coralloides]AFE04954.1 hypothetical protein COCOR_02975 [Corallococcus coralloides DSM 2259]
MTHAFATALRTGAFLMRNLYLTLGLLLFMAPPSHAIEYEIYWETISYVSQGSNLDPILANEGDPYFEVNDLPLPTYTVPLQYRIARNQDRYNAFHALFDSVLLRPGDNAFDFGVTTLGGSKWTKSSELVKLLRPGQPSIVLFSGARNGTSYQGRTHVNFALRDLNPGLADKIDALERAINEDRNKLLGNAGRIADLGAQQARLDGLEAELETLLQKGFDEMTAAELDALLKRYPDVPAKTRQALVDLVADLKKNVEQLRAEIARITTELGLHVDEATSLVEAAVAQAGHDLSSPDHFEPGNGLDDVQDVTVPEVDPNEDFDPDQDPYAAYAQQVLSRLQQQMGNTASQDRMGFLSTVRAWRTNVAAMQRSLEARGAVSTEEWGAFLNARHGVANYVRNYMDDSGWFLDTPIPVDIRVRLDSVLMARTPQAATALKDALSGWDSTMSPEERMLLDTINAMLQGAAAAIFSVDLSALAELTRLTNSIATAAVEVSRFAVGFTPVGDVLDLCEAVTGKKFCMPGGEQLSAEERIASGLGVVIGSGAFWHGVMTVAPVAGRVGRILDNLTDLAAAERQILRTRIGSNALSHLEDLTGTQIKFLADTYGDTFVTTFAHSVGGSAMQKVTTLNLNWQWSKAVHDALFVQNLGATVRNLPPMQGMILPEVELLLTQKGFVKSSSTTAQEIWTHLDGSIVRIAPRGTQARPRIHLKKEVSKIPGDASDAAIACKVTDANALAPQGPNEARSGLNTWFRQATLAKSKNAYARDLTTQERDMLLRVWGDATHVDLSP